MTRLLAIVVFVSACISGCGHPQRDIDARDEYITELETRIEELEAKLAAAQEASEDMQSNLSRLQDENWRDVIPDIESSAADVDSAIEE